MVSPAVYRASIRPHNLQLRFLLRRLVPSPPHATVYSKIEIYISRIDRRMDRWMDRIPCCLHNIHLSHSSLLQYGVHLLETVRIILDRQTVRWTKRQAFPFVCASLIIFPCFQISYERNKNIQCKGPPFLTLIF